MWYFWLYTGSHEREKLLLLDEIDQLKRQNDLLETALVDTSALPKRTLQTADTRWKLPATETGLLVIFIHQMAQPLLAVLSQTSIAEWKFTVILLLKTVETLHNKNQNRKR